MDAAVTPDLKRTLRAQMRAARLRFAVDAAAIAPPPEFIDKLCGGSTLAGYLPLPGEADPALLIAAAIDRGLQVAMPHVSDRATPMRFLAWAPGDPLATGPFELRQPFGDRPELIPDIILTPLVAFDRALNRLGQGAGYYDRAFATLPAVLRIGVAWSIQQTDQLPVDPWDVPLHGMITERGWINPETDA